MRQYAIFPAMVAALAWTCFSQSTTGDILGIVQDPTETMVSSCTARVSIT